MERVFNVVWIDDEWDKMESFRLECEKIHHIHLIPFRTRKEGILYVEQNLRSIDAVLLDAKMFDETEHEVARLIGLRNAIHRLDELSSLRKIPYFISTGQTDLLNNDTFSESFGHFYTKGKDDEILLENMKRTISELPERQIEVKYPDVFQALADMDLDDGRRIVLDILLAVHYLEHRSVFKPEQQYNQLRQLLEYLFRYFHKLGILPDQCVPKEVILNQCSLYLSGKDANNVGVRYKSIGDRIVPKYIERIIRTVLDLCQEHSHTTNQDAHSCPENEDYSAVAKSPYLVFGLIMDMCQVIVWFRDYATAHQDIAQNKSKCVLLNSEIQSYEGAEFFPEKDENGVFHCGDCMLVIRSCNGEKVRLHHVVRNTDPRSKNCYPFFAKYDLITEE